MLPPYVRDSLDDKSMLGHFKKASPLTSLGHSFERRAYWFVLSYQGIPYSHTGRVDWGWWTLCEWLTLILYVRDSLEDKSMLFIHFYLCQEKNRKLWLVSPATSQ